METEQGDLGNTPRESQNNQTCISDWRENAPAPAPHFEDGQPWVTACRRQGEIEMECESGNGGGGQGGGGKELRREGGREGGRERTREKEGGEGEESNEDTRSR